MGQSKHGAGQQKHGYITECRQLEQHSRERDHDRRLRHADHHVRREFADHGVQRGHRGREQTFPASLFTVPYQRQRAEHQHRDHDDDTDETGGE